MSAEVTVSPRRFIGLDIHKFYAIARGVDPQRQPVLGPQRISMLQLGECSRQHFTREDAVVLEVTTNGWQVYDDLLPYVHSVTLVHPPHLALITRAQVMTDSIAAPTLARLHAAGLIPPVWVPPPAVRDARALVAQRAKMVRLATQAKNRLHAVLHRAPPARAMRGRTTGVRWGHSPGATGGFALCARQPQLVGAAGAQRECKGAHPERPGHADVRPDAVGTL